MELITTVVIHRVSYAVEETSWEGSLAWTAYLSHISTPILESAIGYLLSEGEQRAHTARQYSYFPVPLQTRQPLA